ncbi:MAG TPA: cobalamin-independent methionine synthase II family protein [Gaiellaceae bacterium]|nr:cobalamin-independent methionine synthase II family protein [Gaiellaceae bacterium]
MANSSKFRADHVGSLLRPPRLLEARRRLGAGMMFEDELREVEDESIAEAVKLQLDAGIDIVTDGEFRRLDFRSAIVDAFEGIEMKVVEMPWKDEQGETHMLPSRQFTIVGTLQQKRRLTEGDVAFLRTLTKAPLKVTLIAPSFLFSRFWENGVTDQVYSRDELADELVRITRAEIEALIAEGVNYVQLDNPGYAAFLSETSRRGNATFDEMVEIDTAAVQGIERPRGVSIGMHVCRGNQASMWLAEGGYEPVAEKLFQIPVDRFLLEYDDGRSGGFEPLQLVPDEKLVVLGLVSSKLAELESLEELQARIDEAAQYHPVDNLALSPQCGFASISDGGNHMTQEQEFKKLQLVSDTALATWGIEL